jgi:small-conductance mechanosensitive channel
MTQSRSSSRIRSRTHKSLRLRGDAVHTFGTLLAPLAIGLVALGFYLLGTAVAEPLSSNAALVLVASILLALGFVLLSYLLRTAMISHRRPHARRMRIRERLEEQPAEAHSIVVAPAEPPGKLPFQRSYVDSARIRR